MWKYIRVKTPPMINGINSSNGQWRGDRRLHFGEDAERLAYRDEHALVADGSGGAGLDDAEPGQIGVVGQRDQDRLERGADPSLPGRSAVAVGGRRAIEQRVLAEVVRGDEQVVEVAECLVESLRRNAGALADEVDRDSGVPPFTDHLYEGVDQAVTLDRDHLVG